MTWRELAPEPSRFWIRWAPRRRAGTELPFVDLIDRRIVWPEPDGAASSGGPEPVSPLRADLTYLPPARAAEREQRQSALLAFAAAGVPTLLQHPAGAVATSAPATVTVLDLLPRLLAGAGAAPLAVDPSDRPAGQVWVLLPLLPGVIPEPSAFASWSVDLIGLAAEAVVPMPLDLSATDRRRITEALGEESFEAVFHSPAPDERQVSRALDLAGLPLFPLRPEGGSVAPRLARNRRLAAALAEAGELTLGLGGAEPEGQALLAAARHLETTPLDLSAVAAEGNLDVVTWLSPGARVIVAECLGGGRSATLEVLRRRWLNPEVGD